MINRLKEIRQDRDIKAKDIYNRLGIVQSAYSDIETFRNSPKIEYLIFLAHFYNTSIDYLMCLTDDPRPYPRHKI